jgi:hypothetical protein
MESMGFKLGTYYWSSQVIYDYFLGDPNTAQYYFTTRLFASEELVVGTLIQVDSKWQYRPDGWNGIEFTSGDVRPGIVNSLNMIVTQEWQDAFDARGFNLCYDGAKTSLESLHSPYHLRLALYRL